MDEYNCSESQSCEDLLAPICDGFSVEMCDGLFDVNEGTFQVCTVDDDDDIDMNYIFNHTDHAIKVDPEIDMEMMMKEEMDLIEMVAATQNCGEAENH
jgi:myb proto-oncogene protein